MPNLPIDWFPGQEENNMADRRRRRIKLGEGDDSELGSDESEDELNGTRKSATVG